MPIQHFCTMSKIYILMTLQDKKYIAEEARKLFRQRKNASIEEADDLVGILKDQTKSSLWDCGKAAGFVYERVSSSFVSMTQVDCSAVYRRCAALRVCSPLWVSPKPISSLCTPQRLCLLQNQKPIANSTKMCCGRKP